MTPEDEDTATRTVWGEARGELYIGKCAVAWVIKNRSDKGGWWGHTPQEVCQHPYQFSCWNLNDPNREKLINLSVEDPEYQACKQAVVQVFTNALSDITEGATHYAVATLNPSWAEKATKTVTIGNHTFYKDVQ